MLRARRELRESVGMKALIESFALSAGSAVKLKIKPRRAPRAQRGWRKVEQVIFTKVFAGSALSAVN